MLERRRGGLPIATSPRGGELLEDDRSAPPSICSGLGSRISIDLAFRPAALARLINSIEYAPSDPGEWRPCDPKPPDLGLDRARPAVTHGTASSSSRTRTPGGTRARWWARRSCVCTVFGMDSGIVQLVSRPLSHHGCSLRVHNGCLFFYGASCSWQLQLLLFLFLCCYCSANCFTRAKCRQRSTPNGAT